MRKGRDVLFMPNGKKFEMKKFLIYNISGAHASSKAPECQVWKPRVGRLWDGVMHVPASEGLTAEASVIVSFRHICKSLSRVT